MTERMLKIPSSTWMHHTRKYVKLFCTQNNNERDKNCVWPAVLHHVWVHTGIRMCVTCRLKVVCSNKSVHFCSSFKIITFLHYTSLLTSCKIPPAQTIQVLSSWKKKEWKARQDDIPEPVNITNHAVWLLTNDILTPWQVRLSMLNHHDFKWWFIQQRAKSWPWSNARVLCSARQGETSSKNYRGRDTERDRH